MAAVMTKLKLFIIDMSKTKTQVKVSKSNFEPDKAGDFLTTNFDYENVTATEVKRTYQFIDLRQTKL